MAFHRWMVVAVVMALTPPVAVGQREGVEEPLPNPLSLEDALRLARRDHPSIERLAADQMLAQSAVSLAESRYDWTAGISLDARTVDKVSVPGHEFIDDSRATLYLSRLLTDFGEARAATAAAVAKSQGAQLVLDYQTDLHRVEVMHRYLDVRLADLRYFVDDEDMTLAFLRYDRVRERREKFEEHAEVDERELESVFRSRLVDRTRAANQQRSTRNQLALAMGRPGDLPDNVIDPELSVYDRPVPDYDELLSVVLEKHPLMAVNGMLLEAAEQTIRRYEISDRPELLVQLEATEWSLETGNRDQYIAGLQLNVPLGGAPARRARVAEAMAERHRIEADRRALEFELRQEVLELVQRLREIQFEIEAAEANELYRDLYLDRSRTLYQLEVRSDLGDSQARQAEAVWRSAKARFDRALTWARIDIMRGLPTAVLNSEESQ